VLSFFTVLLTTGVNFSNVNLRIRKRKKSKNILDFESGAQTWYIDERAGGKKKSYTDGFRIFSTLLFTTAPFHRLKTNLMYALNSHDILIVATKKCSSRCTLPGKCSSIDKRNFFDIP
jgi:hypothetical protein